MPFYRWQRTIVDGAGNVLPGASVEIRSESTGALVPLFEDIDGLVPAGNPITADGNGYAFAYFEPARVRVVATSGALSFEWRDVLVSEGPFGSSEAGEGADRVLMPVTGEKVSDAVNSKATRPDYVSSGMPLTIRIPTDYPDWQQAIDDLSDKYSSSNKTQFVLLLESGHQIPVGLEVKNGDYSRFSIESEDAVVTLDAGFVGVDDLDITSGTGHLIMGRNARMPELNCRIDMDGAGGDGYYGAYQCSGAVATGSFLPSSGDYPGVINAGRNGCHFRGGIFNASASDFSSAAECGFRLNQGAHGTARFSRADNCGTAPGFTNGSVSVSRASNFNFHDGSATGAANSALDVRRSVVNVQDADLSGAATHAIETNGGGVIFAVGANCSNCTEEAVNARSGSFINLQLGDVSGSGTVNDVRVSGGGSTVILTDCVTSSGSPSIDDVNVDLFNILFPDGTVVDANQTTKAEVGSNANGEWETTAAGTIIATRTVTVDTSVDTILNFDYPVTPGTVLSGGWIQSANVLADVSAITAVSADGPGASRWRVQTDGSGSGNVDISLMMIGRV